MATELDVLQLNFTASTSGADKSLQKLIATLKGVGESIGAVNSQGFTANIENLASTLNNLEFAVNNVDSSKLKSISSGLKSLAKSMSGLTNSSIFTEVASGINAIGNVGNADFTNISTLANAMSKLGSGNGTQAGQNLGQIAVGIRSFQGINIPKLEGITEFSQALRSLGTKNIVSASNALQPLGEALRNFPKSFAIPEGMEQIPELAKALSTFGRKTAVEASKSLPLLTKGLRELFETLATVPHVSQNVIDLTNALSQFVANVKWVGTGSKQASKGLNLFGNTASRVSKKTFSLASAIGKVYATYFLLFRAFGKIRDSINISSQLKEVQNVVDTTFGDMTDKVEKFAQSSIKNFGLSELSAKQYSSRFQAMGVAMGITSAQVTKVQESLNAINPTLASRGYNDLANSMADVSINVTKLAADMASFYNVAQEDVAKDLESIYSGMTRPLRKYGLDLTENTLKEWAMKNGLDANIKSMTQAEKTMLRYQYVMANTSASQGDFAKTSLSWANQVRMLGQNFQRLGSVIGSGFIAWLRPLVVTINSYMDSIIAAVQRVVNALGKIFGWQMIVDTTGEQLIDDTEGVADAWDDATGAAKKYAKQLLGIDELNNLTTQDNSGSGSDSGLGGGLSGGNIIQPGGISFEKFESDIDNLYDLGKKISDKLKDMLSGIDWQSIYDKASNFGSGLADFLNGLFQPETFYQTGRAIAGALNTAINVAFGFGTTFDWENLGESIGERINGFFDEFDFAKLAQTLNVWVQGIWDAIKKAVETIEWKDVFAKLYDFTSNLDVGTVALIIGAITIKKIGRFLISGSFIKLVGEAITQKLLGAPITIKTLPLIIKGLTLGALPHLAPGTATGDLFMAWIDDNILNPLTQLIPEKIRDFFGKTFAGALLGVVGGSWFPGVGTLVGGIVGAIAGAFTSDAMRPIIDAFAKALKTVFKWDNVVGLFDAATFFFDDLSDAFAEKDWLRIGKDILLGIISAIASPAQFVVAPFQNLFEWIFGGICKIFGIHSPAKAMYDIGKNIVLGIFEGFSLVDFAKKMSEWWNKNIKPWFSLERWSEIGNNIKDGLVKGWENAISSIKELWNVFAKWLNERLNFSWDGLSIGGKEIIPSGSLNLGKIPTFANGGFPSQGSLFVAGETYGQSEWVGNINGRTGVVSPSEITGIADAIYQTSAEEMSMLRQQVNLLSGILEKEFGISTNDIGKAARSYGRDYYNRTGNNAYVF